MRCRLGKAHQGYDRLYVPQLGWTTGDLDVHDIAVDGAGRPVFVNTLFSCLATVSESHSFAPVWQPPFISKLAAEDRCHLNGVAVEAGEPRYVTSVSISDVADGWRDHRVAGGVVIDVASGEVVASGLSMPHSPRLHRGRLYLLDSGSGRFGWIEPGSGRFEEVCFCPGYARGLAFVGEFAVIGLSLPRHNRSFSGLPLDDAAEPPRRRAALRPAGGRSAHRRCAPFAPPRRGDPRALRRRRHAGRDPPDGARLPQRRDPSADHHCPGGRLSRSDRA